MSARATTQLVTRFKREEIRGWIAGDRPGVPCERTRMSPRETPKNQTAKENAMTPKPRKRQGRPRRRESMRGRTEIAKELRTRGRTVKEIARMMRISKEVVAHLLDDSTGHHRPTTRNRQDFMTWPPKETS